MLHERSSDEIDKFVYKGQLCIGQIPRHLTSSPSRWGGDLILRVFRRANLIPMHRGREFEPKLDFM